MSRFSCLLAAVLLATACEPTITPLAVPEGLPLTSLSPAQRALLRATLAIDDVRDEATVVLDAEALTISGDLELDNVGDGGTKTATLRIYGRATAESEEVLLGLATSTVTITPKQAVYLDFKGASFETCSAGVDGACSLLFDRNRNGDSNVVDLVASIDPAPAAPFLQASPSTLQFSSGVRLGSFARQVVVVENLAEHPVRIDAVQVAGGQGVGVSLFDPNTGNNSTPRRRLTSADLNLDGDPAGVSDIVLSPGEEVFVAVSFAPVNAFLTTASIQIAATDVVTGVGQGVRTKVIANSDGALRPRDAGYVEPTTTSLNLGGGTLATEAFPASELFSGSDVTSTASSAGLLHTGVSLVATKADGSTLSMPADAAFAVDIAAGQRFAAALDADDDADLALLEVAADGTLTVLSTSQQQGDSSEAVELLNDGAASRNVFLVVGRVGVFAPVAVAGALVAADEPLPFRLSCQLTRGPELDDVEPIAPTRGSLDGGTEVTIRGRGFYVPPTSAGPHVRVTVGGEPVVVPPRIVTADDGTQTVTIVLPSGNNSISDVQSTVVVENPSTNGGDGQAATLPEGFRYDLPTARVTRVAPDVASTSGSTADVTLRGAFFFDLYGTPVVRFDNDVATDVSVVDSTTLLVTVPPHAAGTTQLTVTNVVFGQLEGAPSNPVDFTFVAPQGDAPTLTTVAPTSGTALGGDVVTLTGTGFVSGSRAFFGGNEAVVSGSTATSLTVVTAPVDAAGDVEVAVVNPDGQTAVLAAGFTFALPPPSISAAFPDRAAVAGNTIVVVTGAGFRDDTTVSFTTASGSVEARSVTRTSSTTLLVTTPAAAAGDAELVARNGDGQEASTSFAFFAPQGPPPSALTINPSTGNVGGGTSISLTATGVHTPVVVVFGDTVIEEPAVVPLANGRTRIDVTSPPGEAGNTAVSLVNADGQTATTTFTYVDTQEPRLVGLRPGVVHALIPGDEILGFGEHLSELGSTSSLSAVAVVAVSSLPPQTVRVPLSVQFGSDGFVSLLIDTPLPAGSVAVELSGAGTTIVSEQRLTAAPPDVTRVDLREDSDAVVLVGTGFAGDRLTAAVVGGAPCTITSADERFIACRLTDEPEDVIVSLQYGAIVVDDTDFFVDTGDNEGCTATSCNGHGTCTNVNGVATCACDPGFTGQTCDEIAGEPVVVNDATDLVGPNALCSLREAVAAVTSGAVGDCLVPPGSTLIRLANDVQLTAAGGPILINSGMFIDGDGHTITAARGAFEVAGGAPTLNALTIVGASASTPALRLRSNARLSGITVRNFVSSVSAVVVEGAAFVQVADSTFENNSNTTTAGGALSVDGDVALLNTRFTGNSSLADGGAVFIGATGKFSAEATAFHDNRAQRGGAIVVNGATRPVQCTRCSFTQNNGAAGGGAIDATDADVRLVQSTVANNSSNTSVGGVRSVRGTLSITSSTIVLNTGVSIGGLGVEVGTVLRVKDSIVARNRTQAPSTTQDLGFAGVSLQMLGTNLIPATNVQNQARGDAALVLPPSFVGDVTADALQPSAVVAEPLLMTGTCTDLDGVALGIDQRGAPRPPSGCTLGAVERLADTPTTIVVTGTGDNGGGCTLRDAVEAARLNVPVGGCGPGGALDRIEFDETVTSIVLDGEIEIGGNASLVIDGLVGHDDSVVTISNASGGRVFSIESPTVLAGLDLLGGAFATDGGVVAVTASSVRLVDSTVRGGASNRGGGIYNSSGVVSVVRSTIEAGDASGTAGELLFLDGDGTAFLDRATVVGATQSSMIASQSTQALLFMDRVSLSGPGSTIPVFAGPGRVVAGRSLLEAFGRALCSSESLSAFSSTGSNAFSDASCGVQLASDRPTTGAVLRFANHGGRTKTLSVSPTNPIATTTVCEGEDQRGRFATGLCPPGAFYPVVGTCGDGFVDAGTQQSLLPVGQAFALPFTGDVLVEPGSAFALGAVFADSAGGQYVRCTDGFCGSTQNISSSTTSTLAAVGEGDVGADLFPEVIVVETGGNIRGFTGEFEAFSGSLTAINTVTDAVVLTSPVDQSVHVIAIGTNSGGTPLLERARLFKGAGASPRESFNLGGAPIDLVVKRVNNTAHILVRQLVGGLAESVLASFNFDTDELSFGGVRAPGTDPVTVSAPSTLLRGALGVLWSAQDTGAVLRIARGVQPADVFNLGPVSASSLTAGDIDGNGAEELIAVRLDGTLVVFAEQGNGWTVVPVDGFAPEGAQCRAFDVGATQGDELVCLNGTTVFTAGFGSDVELCDLNNAFDDPCNDACDGFL